MCEHASNKEVSFFWLFPDVRGSRSVFLLRPAARGIGATNKHKHNARNENLYLYNAKFSVPFTSSNVVRRVRSYWQWITCHTMNHMPYNESHAIQWITFHTMNHVPYNESRSIQWITCHTMNHVPYDESHAIQRITFHTMNHMPYNESHAIQSHGYDGQEPFQIYFFQGNCCEAAKWIFLKTMVAYR
jgi:hypothetical protein